MNTPIAHHAVAAGLAALVTVGVLLGLDGLAGNEFREAHQAHAVQPSAQAQWAAAAVALPARRVARA